MQLFKYINRDLWITEDTPYVKYDETTTANTTYMCWDDTDKDINIRRVNETSNGFAKGKWADRVSLSYVAYPNYNV